MAQPDDSAPQGGEEKKGYWKRQTLTAKILIIVFAIIVIGIVAVVAIVMSMPTYTALNVTGDLNSSAVNLDQVTIVGTTDPGATVTVNGNSVTPDSSGKFTYKITDIAMGTMNVTIVTKSTDKLATTAIIQVTRELNGDTYHLETKLINQTNLKISN